LSTGLRIAFFIYLITTIPVEKIELVELIATLVLNIFIIDSKLIKVMKIYCIHTLEMS